MSKLDPRNRPMEMRPPRAAAQARPQRSPTSNSTPRNRALAIGTSRDGFEPPMTGEYNCQGGAPVEVLGRDFQAEQRARDERQADVRQQVGGTPRSGFRLDPYKAE